MSNTRKPFETKVGELKRKRTALYEQLTSRDDMDDSAVQAQMSQLSKLNNTIKQFESEINSTKNTPNIKDYTADIQSADQCLQQLNQLEQKVKTTLPDTKVPSQPKQSSVQNKSSSLIVEEEEEVDAKSGQEKSDEDSDDENSIRLRKRSSSQSASASKPQHAYQYDGDETDLAHIHKNLDTIQASLDLYKAQTKLALRSARQRKALKQKDLDKKVEALLVLLQFYRDDRTHPFQENKKNVNKLIDTAVEIAKDFKDIRDNKPQDKMPIGSSIIAEYLDDTVEEAKKKMGNYLDPQVSIVQPGQQSSIKKEINLELGKPYLTVNQVSVAGKPLRTATLQYIDDKTHQLRTDYHLEKDHDKKMAEIPRQGSFFATIPGEEIVYDVASKVMKHISHPNGADSPVIFCGEGLSPDEVEMHFILYKLYNVKVHPLSFTLSHFTQKEFDKISDTQLRLAEDCLLKRAKQAAAPGEVFSKAEAEKIEAELNNVIEHQPHKP